MSAYVKSIDANHLLEIWLDGYYGPEKRESTGGWLYGTDYIRNNQITGVDFGTIHVYPDKWFVDTKLQHYITTIVSFTGSTE